MMVKGKQLINAFLRPHPCHHLRLPKVCWHRHLHHRCNGMRHLNWALIVENNWLTSVNCLMIRLTGVLRKKIHLKDARQMRRFLNDLM